MHRRESPAVSICRTICAAARRAFRRTGTGRIKLEASRGFVRIVVALCLVVLVSIGAFFGMRIVARRLASSPFSDRLPFVFVVLGLAVVVYAVDRARKKKKGQGPDTDAA